MIHDDWVFIILLAMIVLLSVLFGYTLGKNKSV